MLNTTRLLLLNNDEQQHSDLIQICPDKAISQFVGFTTISLSLRYIALPVLRQLRPEPRHSRQINSWQVFCLIKY